MNSRHTKLLLAASVSLALLPGTQAQEISEQAESDSEVEVITVQARGRVQVLKDVPAAVSVLTDFAIERENITTLEGLVDQVPNFVITTTPFQPVVNIRGMGTGGGTRAFEQSVSTYVDGIYAGRANQFLAPVFDVQSIEVVKGPQTVMFGVNAIAGGVDIKSKRPSGYFEGFVSAGYEFENEGWRTDGAVSFPVTDTLSVRLAGRKGVDGGYLENTALNNRQEPEADYDLMRGTVVWDPSDKLKVTFIKESSNRDITGNGFQMIYLADAFDGAFGDVETGKVDFKKSGNGSSFSNIESDNNILNIEWSVGDFMITSVTGYSSYDFEQELPAGYVPIDAGTAKGIEDFEQTYQEFRLISPVGSTVDYILGASFFNQELGIYQGVDLNLPALAPGAPQAAIRNGMDQETDSYAVFGQLTYHFSPKFRAIFGLRYSDVEKDVDYTIGTTTYGSSLITGEYALDPTSFFVLSSPDFGWLTWFDPTDMSTMYPGIIEDSVSLSSTDPSFTLQWDISDNLATYATFAEGTKAGGFNDQEKASLTNGDFTYEPEEATNYEVGAKYAEGDLRLNLAIFYTEFDNLQVSQSFGNQIVTTNASSVVSKGLEMDARYTVDGYVVVGGDLALLDSYYKDFPGAGCTADAAAQGCIDEETNAAGRNTELSADIVGSFFVEATYPVFDSSMELTLRARAYYNDGYQMAADYDPIDYQDSFWKFSALAELKDMDGQWVLSLSGKNLSNEAIIGYGGDAALGLGHQGYTLPGRQIFLNLRWNFGEF